MRWSPPFQPGTIHLHARHIAAELGCKTAVTHKVSREDREQYHLTGDDSGHAIAERMGMICEIRDPKAYLGYNGMPEAEFASTGYDDEALVMSSFEGDFRQKLVITGMHGENVWNRISKTPSRKTYTKWMAVAVPYPNSDTASVSSMSRSPILWLHGLPSINRISNSGEMAPWTLWNNYDRPIPRRIVEEKGVNGICSGRKNSF